VADTLEARGHQLMEDGDYSAAIPVLRQAVAHAPHDSLTYAYALYDLGRSLRLAGDPRDAVTVLYERLQIPNQTETVREQLQLALQALGQTASQSGGASSGGAGQGAQGDQGGGGGGGGHGARDHHGGPGPGDPTRAAGAGAPQPGPPPPGAAQPVPLD
jgi:tetratricopeptide (TPR) repeat protein